MDPNLKNENLFENDIYKIDYYYKIIENDLKFISKILVNYKQTDMQIEICPNLGNISKNNNFTVFVRPFGTVEEKYYEHTRRCLVSSTYQLLTRDINLKNKKQLIKRIIHLANILGKLSYKSENPFNATELTLTQKEDSAEFIFFPSIQYSNDIEEEIFLEEEENNHAVKIDVNKNGIVSFQEWVFIEDKEIYPGIITDDYNLFEYQNIAEINQNQLDIIFGEDEDKTINEFIQIFKKECNKHTYDPFIFQNDPRFNTKELEWHKGSKEDLINFIKSIVYSQPEYSSICNNMFIYIDYYAAGYHEGQSFGNININYNSNFIGNVDYKDIVPIESKIDKLIKKYSQIIFEKVYSEGWEFIREKDMKNYKESNFYIKPKNIEIIIEPPNPHEIIDYKIKLKQIKALYERHQK